MFKCFIVNIMHQYAPAFIVVCILLCLSFNYTFPLHRETKEWYSIGLSSNRSRKFCIQLFEVICPNLIKSNGFI